MKKEDIIKIILDNTMDTSEVLEMLDINRQRLSQLATSGLLVPLKRGLYLRQDVEKRKAEQEVLRKQYYRPTKEKKPSDSDKS